MRINHQHWATFPWRAWHSYSVLKTTMSWDVSDMIIKVSRRNKTNISRIMLLSLKNRDNKTSNTTPIIKRHSQSIDKVSKTPPVTVIIPITCWEWRMNTMMLPGSWRFTIQLNEKSGYDSLNRFSTCDNLQSKWNAENVNTQVTCEKASIIIGPMRKFGNYCQSLV